MCDIARILRGAIEIAYPTNIPHKMRPKLAKFQNFFYHSSCQNVLKQYANAISCRPHTMCFFSASHLYVICVPSLLARISSSPCGGTISHSRDLRYRHMSMRSASFISPRHSVCVLPLRSILCTSCCVSFFVVAITPDTRRGPAVITGPLVCKKSKGGLYKMPVEKEKPWHGLALECPGRTRTCIPALCYASLFPIKLRAQ